MASDSVIDAAFGVLCAASCALIVVVPPDGPGAWVRDRIVRRVPIIGGRLAECVKCLSVWTGLAVGVPVTLAPGWAQAAAAAVVGPFLMLWLLERFYRNPPMAGGAGRA